MGLRWIFDLLLDEDDKPRENDQMEFPAELECWWGIISVYAQGTTYNDSVKIGVISISDLEGASTFAELDILTEKLVRAVSRQGITASNREFRQDPRDPNASVLVVPVTMGAEDGR